jgi:hypothetical protein
MTTKNVLHLLFGAVGALMVSASVLSATAQNTAPVLDNSKTPVLAPINEDAAVPTGAVGTLVSSLVDLASVPGQLDNFVDPDTGALVGIAITAADSSNGSWFYSIDGGASWTLLGGGVVCQRTVAGRQCEYPALLPTQPEFQRHDQQCHHVPGMGSNQRQ